MKACFSVFSVFYYMARTLIYNPEYVTEYIIHTYYNCIHLELNGHEHYKR